MTEFQLRSAYYTEFARLRRMNHTRILVTWNDIQIDVWCDGNEEESQRVIQISRKIRDLTSALQQISIIPQ